MAISVRNIYKKFGDKEVLKDISFEFMRGKINMIIGASGSGKSVLLKNIVGLMQPDAGEIMYGETNMLTASYEEIRLLRKKIGMLFQASALFDSMNVEENVSFPMKMFTDWKKHEILERVNFCLDRVELSTSHGLYPSELSGGMRKRVALARAIALNPEYLFVDEPNSGLDPLTSKVVDELIQELTYEFNMTTVIVSHDMNSVINISDKIMFIYQGRKEWEGTKKEILRSGNANLDRFVFVSDLIRRDL